MDSSLRVADKWRYVQWHNLWRSHPRKRKLRRSSFPRNLPLASLSRPNCSFENTPSPGLQEHRGTCRFGRYKNSRRPHPPRRASRASPSPTPCKRRSPMLTYPYPPSTTAVRSTNRLRLCCSISGPWSARPQWAGTLQGQQC